GPLPRRHRRVALRGGGRGAHRPARRGLRPREPARLFQPRAGRLPRRPARPARRVPRRRSRPARRSHGRRAPLGPALPALVKSSVDRRTGARRQRAPAQAPLYEALDWLAVEAVPEVRRSLRLLANPTAFPHAGRLYLSEPAPAGGAPAGRPAVSVRATGAVLEALELARAPVAYGALVDELAARPGASRERAEELVETLWRQTFLLTDLRPPLPAADP